MSENSPMPEGKPAMDKRSKSAWAWPFNHFQEEWPEVRRAKWSFFLCAIAAIIIGAAAIFSLFSIFIIPGKQGQIDLLNQKLNDAKDYPEIVALKNKLEGETNELTIENSNLLAQFQKETGNNASLQTQLTMSESNKETLADDLFMFREQIRIDQRDTPNDWGECGYVEFANENYRMACRFWKLLFDSQPPSSDLVIKHSPLYYYATFKTTNLTNREEAMHILLISVQDFTSQLQQAVVNNFTNDDRNTLGSLQHAQENLQKIQLLLPPTEAGVVADAVTNVIKLQDIIRKRTSP